MAASKSMTETPNPLTPSSDYQAMADYWKMVGAILHGVDALRASALSGTRAAVAGPAIPYATLQQLSATRRGRTGSQSPYLPQFPEEENEDYEFRRKNAPLTNIYDDVSRNLASKPFSKTLELDEETSEDLKQLSINIDGQGNNLHVFSAELFKAGIDYAIDWIWVDYSRIPSTVVTLADERTIKARPYWVRIPAINMLAIYSDFVNGKEVFVHARIYEPYIRRDGFKEIRVESVRILDRQPIYDQFQKIIGYDNATWRLLELVTSVDAAKRETKDWKEVDQGIISIGIIPLVPFRTGKRDGCSWKIMPPLKNIAHMQIEEFQQESNLKTTKELTAFPMLTGNGVSPVDASGTEVRIRVGPHAVLFAPPQMDGSATGSWNYIEPNASSLTFLKNDLEGLRTEMRDLGMQPLATANLTVITTANVSMKAHNQVQAWALGLKDSLEQAWKITCLWLGRVTEEPIVRVHTDFGVDFEAGSELTALQAARANKDLSQRTLWSEFKRRGTLSDDFDPDLEEEELAKESEALQPEIPIDPITGQPLAAPPPVRLVK